MVKGIHPWTYCLVMGVGVAAEESLRLPHNTHSYESIDDDDDLDATTVFREAEETPIRTFGPRGRLALTLEPEKYIDLRKGVIFGSDTDRCDILLHPDRSLGVSAMHFALHFAWDNGPDPTILILACLSRNGIRLHDTVLGIGQTQVLNPYERHMIEVADRHFEIEVIIWKESDNRAGFDARWQNFVREVEMREPKTPLKSEQENKVTPWQPIDPRKGGAVRYMGTEELVHCRDLCGALSISTQKFTSLKKALGLKPASQKHLNKDLYLTLKDACKLCEASEMGRQAATHLRQAVRVSGSTRKTVVTLIHPKFRRSSEQSSTAETSISAPNTVASFVLLQELYDGDWSRVYKMAERTTGRLVAVKVIKPQTNIKLVNNIVEEVKFLGSLKHPRILEVEAIDETDEGFKVRMEYLPLGDLRAYVDLHGTLKDSPAARFTDQILDALAFLHGQKLVHRDIKPGNIMISALVPFEVKLTDLGLIKVIEAGKNVHLTQCGSPAYMAPEIWDGHPSKGKAAVGARQDQKIDIWALGVTLWFTLCKEHPFVRSDNPFSRRPNYEVGPDTELLTEHKVSKGAVSIMRLMMDVEPKNRPSAKTLRQDPWIAGRQG